MASAGTLPAEKGLSSTTLENDAPYRHRSAPQNEEDSPSTPPDGGYGWTIVVAILFLNAVTWGTTILLSRPNSTDI